MFASSWQAKPTAHHGLPFPGILSLIPFLPPLGRPLPSKTHCQHSSSSSQPVPPPSSAGYHWFSTSWEWPALFCLLGRAETRKGGKIIQMSSWIDLLKAASALPQRGHTAKETWGGLNSRKSGWKWLWVARKAFPAFLSDENPPFPRRKGGRVPLLGDCFGMRKASRDRLLGKGERGLAGWAGPLSTSLEPCRAVGRRLNLTPVLLAAIYTHSDISV